MAGKRTLGNAALTLDWDIGASYKDEADANLRRIATLLGGSIIDQVASEPGSPSVGQAWIATDVWAGSTANDIMLYDENLTTNVAGWVILTPWDGLTIFDENLGYQLIFTTAGGWERHVHEPYSPPTAPATAISDETSSRNMTNTDFAGLKILEGNHATGITLTIPSGLTGVEPCTVIQVGAGPVTFAASSTTINSKDSNLLTNGQWSAVTIIPTGSDVYHLIGDLTSA